MKQANDFPKTSKNWLTKWPWLVVATAVTAGGAYWGLHDSADSKPREGKFKGFKGEKGENPIVTVAVANSQQGDMPIYLNGLGTVTALHTVTVRSRVDGELIKVAFTEGQLVKQGDLLAEIDPRPYQVQLQQAQGQLMRDEALLKNAQIDASRYQTLLEQDSIAPQQTATQAALVKQYQGTVEIDRALVDNAKLQLSYAHITAPVSGRIGLRLVDQGNMIHSNDANGLAVITQLQPISVVFTLPEDQIPAVMQRWHRDNNITIEAYDRAGNSKLADGELLAVDNQIDTTTGTLKLKAQFENQQRTLFSNQFVNIKMKLDTLQRVILAPNAAIQHGANGAFVYVVKDDLTITVKAIKTAASDGNNTVISEGLSVDEKLVIDGADKLREGSQVNIAGQTPPARPENANPESKRRRPR
jgi:multidrug efflux system membrane fusion protein